MLITLYEVIDNNCSRVRLRSKISLEILHNARLPQKTLSCQAFY